jgi:hypothetical protein
MASKAAVASSRAFRSRVELCSVVGFKNLALFHVGLSFPEFVILVEVPDRFYRLLCHLPNPKDVKRQAAWELGLIFA